MDKTEHKCDTCFWCTASGWCTKNMPPVKYWGPVTECKNYIRRLGAGDMSESGLLEE